MLLTIGHSFRHFPTSHWLWMGEPGQYGSWHSFRILDRNRKFFSTKFPVNGTSLYSFILFNFKLVKISSNDSYLWLMTRQDVDQDIQSYLKRHQSNSSSVLVLEHGLSHRSNNQSASILIFIYFFKIQQLLNNFPARNLVSCSWNNYQLWEILIPYFVPNRMADE